MRSRRAALSFPVAIKDGLGLDRPGSETAPAKSLALRGAGGAADSRRRVLGQRRPTSSRQTIAAVMALRDPILASRRPSGAYARPSAGKTRPPVDGPLRRVGAFRGNEMAISSPPAAGHGRANSAGAD